MIGGLAGLAIGGMPNARARIDTRIQAGGLAALFVLVVLVVGVRAATFS